MYARHGLGLKQPDRAMLGEQFRDDVNALIIDQFTTLKKKKSPQDTEISSIIRSDCRDISMVLLKYYRFLNSRKIFLVTCKLCGNMFLAGAKNTLYCADCKVLQKKTARRFTARNAPVEFIRNGRGLSISSRISYTKTRLLLLVTTTSRGFVKR